MMGQVAETQEIVYIDCRDGRFDWARVSYKEDAGLYREEQLDIYRQSVNSGVRAGDANRAG